MDLRTIRTKKKLTQAEISKVLGIARASYANIESGKRKPSVKVAQKIGMILDIPWIRLFDDDEKKEGA